MLHHQCDSVFVVLCITMTSGEDAYYMNAYTTSPLDNANPLLAMSLDELWRLFPLTLVEPKSDWVGQYSEMKTTLENLLYGTSDLRIHHIGSTALAGIKTKDIVDILIEVSPDESLDQIAHILEEYGFICMAAELSHISLNYGYTPQGYADKVYHIHLRYRGDNDELYFRDYLIDHPDIARQYETLKMDLCRQYVLDRDAYTAGKTAFIQTWTKAGKSAYKSRYQ